MEALAKLCNAAVVLPFTAGEPSKNHHSIDNIRPNDGSISGLILVSSVFVIVILSMIGIEFVGPHVDKTTKYIIIHSYLGIVIFQAIFVCIKHLLMYRRRLSQIKEKMKSTSNVKNMFLWFFTIGSIFFSLTKIVRTVQCKKQKFEEFKMIGCMNTNVTYYNSYEIVYVSFNSIQIIFILVQSCFLQTFTSFRFISS